MIAGLFGCEGGGFWGYISFVFGVVVSVALLDVAQEENQVKCWPLLPFFGWVGRNDPGSPILIVLFLSSSGQIWGAWRQTLCEVGRTRRGGCPFRIYSVSKHGLFCVGGAIQVLLKLNELAYKSEPRLLFLADVRALCNIAGRIPTNSASKYIS